MELRRAAFASSATGIAARSSSELVVATEASYCEAAGAFVVPNIYEKLKTRERNELLVYATAG